MVMSKMFFFLTVEIFYLKGSNFFSSCRLGILGEIFIKKKEIFLLAGWKYTLFFTAKRNLLFERFNYNLKKKKKKLISSST